MEKDTMKKSLTVLLLALLFSVNAYALTLDETISMALESDHYLKSQQFTFEARKLDAGRAVLLFLPAIGVTYDFQYGRKDFTKNNNPVKKLIGDPRGMNSNFSFYASLNIFNGLSDLMNYQMASLRKTQANQALDAARYDTVLNAQLAYTQVLSAKNQILVAESYLKTLERQKRDAQISAENGVIARSDLLQTEAALAQAVLQKLQADSAYAIALKELEKIINRQIPTNETFEEPQLTDITLEDETTLKDKMFANNSNIKQLETGYKLTKKNRFASMSGIYPKIDFQAGYYAYGVEHPFTGLPDSLSSADRTMGVGVTASWDIKSIASASVDSISKEKESRAFAHNVAGTKRDMTLNLQRNIELYTTSKAQLAQAKVAVQAAEENYRVTKNLYDQSATTMEVLLTASSRLNDAKFLESNARFAMMRSIYSLERLIQEKLQ